jgi:hypothetical protein
MGKIRKKSNEKNKNEKWNIVKKNQQLKNQFGKSSALIPLASNPGTGTYDWGFLSVSVWLVFWAVWRRVLPFFVGQLRGK